MRTFDPERFLSVRDEVLASARVKNGIGTLSEKTLHRILKQYFEPLSALHEQKLGRYVADILNEEGVTEIQTRNLSAMRAKLAAFLSVTHVTLVHPVVHKKWLTWIDPETGECTGRRKSPKVGTVYGAFWELGVIPEYLSHPNLTVYILMLDMEETRLLNGWSKNKKRGSTRADRIPTALVKEYRFDTKDDYLGVLPDKLPDPFTRAELALLAGEPKERMYCVLRVLSAVGAVKEAGKRGREKLYTVCRDAQAKENMEEA